jgi:hypothetical protein
VTAASLGELAARLHADMAIAVGKHPTQGRLGALLSNFHGLQCVVGSDDVQPGVDGPPAFSMVSRPSQGEMVAGTKCVRVAFQDALWRFPAPVAFPSTGPFPFRVPYA